MTIIDFVNEYNYMCNGQTETLSKEELDELHVLVAGMMLDNCGKVVKFMLTNKGQIELHTLPIGDTNEPF